MVITVVILVIAAVAIVLRKRITAGPERLPLIKTQI